MAVYLIFILPNGKETRVHLESNLLIGRGDDCDVVIGEAGVSNHHANISFDSKGKILVVDLNSSNGSFKNGEQISKTFLQVNDTLNLNKVKVRIEETKLSPNERTNIGKTKASEIKGDLTLPGLTLETKKTS